MEGKGVRVNPPPPTHPPSPKTYFLKLTEGMPVFLTEENLVLGGFLKISFKNHVPLPSYRYFVKSLRNGFLCSTICLLRRFCDVFMLT